MPNLTLEELQRSGGRKDGVSYVAVSGEIYDVSSSPLWKEGHHMGHSAGDDLTEALSAAPHGKEVLENFGKVGLLVKPPTGTERVIPKIAPAWISRFISLHSHPILVHFPQAFFVTAPLFLILFYAAGSRCFERTAYYLLCIGFLTAIPATVTGFLHWWFKFGGRVTPLFKLKIFLSLMLLPVAALALVLHTIWGPLASSSVNWIVLVPHLSLIPLAVILGRAGGSIVFSGMGR